jgi:two-component system CheB/CheR fusion protein
MAAQDTPQQSTEEMLFALAREQESEHALIVLNRSREVVAWSGAASKMFGYSAEEMRDATLDRLFTPEDQERGEVDNEYETALSYGRADDDRWLVRKDGLRIWVSGVLTSLKTAEVSSRDTARSSAIVRRCAHNSIR